MTMANDFLVSQKPTTVDPVSQSLGLDERVAERVRVRYAELNPKHIALSLRYPRLAPIILATHRSQTYIHDTIRFGSKFSSEKLSQPLPISHAWYRHESLLRKRLSVAEDRLTKAKIHNLTLATQAINGMVIKPGQIFSFWRGVGPATTRRGYIQGMLLSRGTVVEGVGGGLCQLSNLLHWVFLHAPMTILERHHHSFDPFPDNRRFVPFGGGATVAYNILDLKAGNSWHAPLVIRVWLSARYLYGKLTSSSAPDRSFHVYEKKHCFIGYRGIIFRHNELWRETVDRLGFLRSEMVTANRAPILYSLAPNTHVFNLME